MTMDEQYEWHRSFLKRHRVSRRNFLWGSAAAAMAAGLGSAFGGRGVA
ncbi:twin-arginine translocation signal domain-containing protein, partial [Nocardia sp. NPDC004722]